MAKPCSWVRRRLSGEVTIIQCWALRWGSRLAAPPRRRRRRLVLDLDDSAPAAGSEATPASSDILEIVAGRRARLASGLRNRPQIELLGNQGDQVAGLGQVADLVVDDQLADL